MQKNNSKTVFQNIFIDLYRNGRIASPRNQKVIELENYSYVLPPYIRFPNFENRKYKLSYVKQEFLWYLKGDPKDLSICDYASLWKTLINKNGTINSNYGQYIFGPENQFENVLNTLKQDKDSRRASITILNSNHLFSDTKDVPCTYSLNFRIRQNELNMTVHMRSQDAVFGMGNDAPAFSFIHEMLQQSLLENYPELKLGDYTHFADSFHIYEKHFDMLECFIDPKENFEEVICPKINGIEEVNFLRNYHKFDKEKSIHQNFHFTKWLLNENK